MGRLGEGTLLDRRLLFVTGKGGVGKTGVATAMAALAAEQGRRVLLCETDGRGDLARMLETEPLAFAPREVLTGLHAMVMDTEESLREYLRLYVRIPLIARVGALARTFDFVANAAPGVKEILTVGKLVHEVRAGNFDLVVVDSPATGHVVGQLVAPEAIAEVVHLGMVRDQVGWILETLQDARMAGVVVVTTPEEMPVTETVELVERLAGETQVDLASVVVNNVLPELFGVREEQLFAMLRRPDALGELERRAGPGVHAVLEGADLAVRRRRSRAAHLERLQRSLPAAAPLIHLPYLFIRHHGVRATRQLAEALGAELGVRP